MNRRWTNRCSLWKLFIPIFLYLCYYVLSSHDFGRRRSAPQIQPVTEDTKLQDNNSHTNTGRSLQKKGPLPTSNDKPPHHLPKPKLILYWNQFFNSKEFKFGVGQSPFIQHGCEVTSCESTNEKWRLKEADAVVFHGAQVDSMPGIRPPGQIYVFVQKEPWMDISNRLLPTFKGTMNLTMTYRRDSDIHLPYAFIYKNTSAVDLRKRIFVDPNRKKKSVVWVVSHCDTDSKREYYVNELKKHIDVDVYGECGDHQCSKAHNRACWEMFSKTYRFVLAFESDVCKDYVSEKVYRPLESDIIPIVYGGANYSEVTPPHSVINVKDFNNPKHLAKYLKHLSADKRDYHAYFKWKHHGYAIERYRRTIIGQGFCKMCQILNDKNYEYQDYSDIRKWWVDGSCDRNKMRTMMSKW